MCTQHGGYCGNQDNHCGAVKLSLKPVTHSAHMAIDGARVDSLRQRALPEDADHHAILDRCANYRCALAATLDRQKAVHKAPDNHSRNKSVSAKRTLCPHRSPARSRYVARHQTHIAYKQAPRPLMRATNKWFISSLPLLLLVSLLPLSHAQFYPPVFNAALNRPVTVEPVLNICGEGEDDKFCRSDTDAGTLTACWEDTCTMKCPHSSKLPYMDLVFGRVRDGWGDCVSKRYDDLVQAAPAAKVEAFRVNFLGNGNGTCHLNLVPEWMTVILIQAVRSVTLAMWIRPSSNTMESTIFAIGTRESQSVLRLGMTSKLQLFLTSHNQPWTSRSQWKLPVDQWTHMVLRIHNETVSMAFNGTYVPPSVYGVKFLPSHVSSQYRIGQSFSGNDFFKGDIQDFRIFVKSVSNREVGEIYEGELPFTRVQTSCRCPADHPQLKPADSTYCITNEGSGQPTSEAFRLDRESYPLQYINDGKTGSAWLGKVGIDETTLTVSLAAQYEVLSVSLLFYSTFPDTIIIERRADSSMPWSPWQYYAHDCPTKFNLPVSGTIGTERAVNCRPMISEEIQPASKGIVLFDLLEDRPGRNGSVLSYALRQFLQAEAVRITLKGQPFSDLEKKKYHGIFEISVNARCDCHSRGISCNTSVPEYICGCAPETYTRGRQCEECILGTYRDTTKGDYSPDACKPCDCEVDGTVSGNTTCEHVGGQCYCKKNVGRRRCDTCLPGYHSFDPENSEGCQKCTCHEPGTTHGSSICEASTAQCPCKAQVDGLQCDRCKEGFYLLEASNEEGCKPCQCDPSGVIPGDMSCDQTSGQCNCRGNVTGLKCDNCDPGFYRRPEDPACLPCECDSLGSTNTVCNSRSGQCPCRQNVLGRRCDRCQSGFFAEDLDDLKASGCSRSCDCNKQGIRLDDNDDESCAMLGGQCPCLNNTLGRRCDQCTQTSYDFGASVSLGCLPCDCHPHGSKNMSCDITTGQCFCLTWVESRQCNRCKTGYYGLQATTDQTERSRGCKPCDCYVPGTQEGQMCDPITGRCQCKEGAGDPAVTKYKCAPYLTGIVPTYGPESGGTRVELRGGFLGNIMNTEVKVGSLKCPLLMDTENDTNLLCLTQPLRLSSNQEEAKNVELQVRLRAQDRTAIAPDKFTYLEDPTIDMVTPRQTFLQGGLILTVTGNHLNSVFRPLMEVTMEEANVTSIFSSVCSVHAPAIMHCPTPNISLPEHMATGAVRKKRQALMSPSGDHGARRVRRATDEGQPINQPGILQFYLGFVLDGVTIYRNLADTIPEFAVLKVYLNPHIRTFTETQRTRLYQPYWPFNHQYLMIRGARLDYAATAADYRVEIGKGVCEDIELKHNVLTCLPPSRQPDPKDDHGINNGLPAVVVSVGNIRVHLGWMDYEHNFWENLQFRYGVLGGLAALILFIVLVICCVCCCRRSSKEEKHPHLELASKGQTNNAYIAAYNGSQTSYMSPTMELLSLLPERLRHKVEECLIDYKRMEIGKLIGQGHFGRIHVGRLSSEDHSEHMSIAVKTLREYHVTPRDVANFLDEATIMKDLDHEHVLELLGVVIENNRAYVLLPYMENGDLKSFISNEGNLLTVGELISFGHQVADGMCYLAEQKFVHRDLAARNCMVDRNLVVKIADFGLSRELYESDYYREGEATRPLPVKWMSYESLERSVYTTMSDVWSFGVLLWELMTRGCTPYPDVDSFDMKVYIACGNRMDKPDFAPHDLYELMQLCWQKEPESRPTFLEIYTRLGEILEGQNSTTIRKNHERHVRPLSYGQHNGYTDISREMEY